MDVPHPDVPMADLAADMVPTSYLNQGDSSHTLSGVKRQSSQFPQAGVERTKPLYFTPNFPSYAICLAPHAIQKTR